MTRIVPQNGAEIKESKVQLMLATPKNLHQFWPVAVEFLEQSPEVWEDYFDIPSILADVTSDQMQLWLFRDEEEIFLAVFTRLVPFPKCLVCAIDWLVGRDALRAIPSLELIEQWAWSKGAAFMELEGRRAWIKLLRDFGYETREMRVRKDLRKRRLH